MPRWSIFRLTRPLQIGFLVLLGLSSAQLAWWLIDQVQYAGAVRSRLLAEHHADAEAAGVLSRLGLRTVEVLRLYPHLDLAADSATFVVSPRERAMLDRDRHRRLNRYAWEGAFFLAVLLGAMSVVYRALHEEAQLRRRQEGFLAAVSHELKSPLASLRLSTETLALRDPPAERRAELVRRLLEDLGRLERMIKNTLDTSRLSATTPRTHPEEVELADEVVSALAELRPQAEEGGVTVVNTVPRDLIVHADRDAVRTILRNLLDNAIRSAGEGGGGRVKVESEVEPNEVRLSLWDDGIGFPPAEASLLFEKFYRVEGDDRGRHTGTGLGLYLVRRCAELDGGRVVAHSDGPGRGAVFSVTWPRFGRNTT